MHPLRKNFAPFAVKVFSLINNRKAREGNTTQRAAKRINRTADFFAPFAVKQFSVKDNRKEGKKIECKVRKGD